MLRKLVLIAVLSAVAKESTTYLNLAQVVAIGALVVFAYFKPFAEAEVNQLHTLTLLVTSLTIFYGIMLNAPQGDVTSADSNERSAKACPLAHATKCRSPDPSFASGRERCWPS